MARAVLLSRAAGVCVDFARQLHFHRAINRVVEEHPSNFWILASNNYVDMAILDWCHLFGSRSDELHFTNVLPNPDEFRDAVLQELNWSHEQLQEHRERLKSYRDTQIAHNQITLEVRAVPELDVAMNMVENYYNTILPELREIRPGYPIFRNLLNSLQLQQEELSETLLPDTIHECSNRRQV